MEPFDFTWVALTLAVLMMLLFAVGQAGLRAGLPSDLAGRLVLLAAAGCGLWLTLVTMVANTGAFTDWEAVPPRLMVFPFSATVFILLIARSVPFARLAMAVPAAWPIAAQTFRLFVELQLHALYREGDLPQQMTWEGRNFDVLVGITAPVCAGLVAGGWLPRWAAVGWNVVGLVLLINVVGIAVTSTPGPLHLQWPGPPLTVIARWPVAWLPTFLVPFALFAHVVSLRQLLGQDPAPPAR